LETSQQAYFYIIRGASRLQLYLVLWIIMGIIATAPISITLVFLIVTFTLSGCQFNINSALLIIAVCLLIPLIPLFIYMSSVMNLSKWKRTFHKYWTIALALLVLTVIRLPLAIIVWEGVLCIAVSVITPSGVLQWEINYSSIIEKICAETPSLCLSSALIELVIGFLSIILVGVFVTIKREVVELLATTPIAREWHIEELGRLSTATLVLRISLIISLLASITSYSLLVLPSELYAITLVLGLVGFALGIVGVIIGYTGLSRVKSIIAVFSASERLGVIPLPV